MKTSEKIAKARNNVNLTQDQLAEALGVSRQTISKWELDVTLPETSKLVKLSEVLEVSIDYLLHDELDKPTVKLPMKKGPSGAMPDWSEMYPVIKTYEREVDVEHYAKKHTQIFEELQRKYNYSQEDAMLVSKEILAKVYFKDKNK